MTTETRTLETRKLNRTKSVPKDLRAWLTAECKRLGIDENSFKNLALRAIKENGITVQFQSEVN